MKLGKVAVGADGKVYFASGLDGYVLHLLDDRHEVLCFEFPGQVRDVDCGGEEHTVYFSVVPTPQNSEPLADGKIYRRDLWQGQPSEIATVRQADVGGDWWGAFAVNDGDAYIATLSTPSRLYKLTSAGAEPVFLKNKFRIEGFGVDQGGAFVFADGAGGVYRTNDFEDVETLIQADRKFTDVAARPNVAVEGGRVDVLLTKTPPDDLRVFRSGSENRSKKLHRPASECEGDRIATFFEISQRIARGTEYARRDSKDIASGPIKTGVSCDRCDRRAAYSGATSGTSSATDSDLGFLLDHWSSISDATRRQILALIAADLRPST